jgi:hypothetical protein
MQLEAAVYRNKTDIPQELADDEAEVNPVTGEVTSPNWHIPDNDRFACGYRLGSEKYIANCRRELEGMLTARGLGAPVLLDKLLGPDAETGDVLRLKDVHALRRELALVNQQRKQSADIRELVFRIGKLADAAIEQQNPIVLI